MSSALTSKRLNNSSVASPETATSVEQTMENEAAAFEVLWWASGRDDDDDGGVCLNLQQRPPPRRPIGNIGCSDEVGHDVALWTTYGERTGRVYR